jgi:TonB family protein
MYLLQTTIIWLALYLTFRLCIGRASRFGLNRLILLSSLLLGLVLPEWLPDWAAATAPPAVGDAVIWLDTLYLQSVGAPAARSFTVWPILFYVGAAMGLLRLLAGLYQIYRLRRAGRATRVDGIRVIRLPQHTEPFAWGPYLFWSDDPDFDPTERAAVLAHERAHIRLGHTLDLLLFDLLLIPFWWHPVLYAYRAELRRLHEYQADAYALRRGYDAKNYARLLLRRALGGSRFSLGARPVLSHPFHASHLKTRIDMINQPTPHRAVWKYFLLLPALALALYACDAVEEAPVPEGADPTVAVAMDTELQTSDGEKVYKVVEQMPVFGNCEGFSGPELMRCSNTNLITHIIEHIKYPEAAEKAGIEGLTVVSFIVSSDGSVTGAELKRSSLPEGKVAESEEAAAYQAMDAAVIAAVQELPDFTSAGVQSGKAVHTQLMLPVKFKLD